VANNSLMLLVAAPLLNGHPLWQPAPPRRQRVWRGKTATDRDC